MSAADALHCAVDDRRKRLFGNADYNGLDYLDVADDQRSLCLHFFGQIPEGLIPANFTICGGRRIRDIAVTSVQFDESHDEELDDCLKLTLNHPGDFSDYQLCIVDVPGIDPRFACLDFSFKTNCPSDLDCGDAAPCPPETYAEPDISYLAKDYASFRQLIYDRLALIMPDWRERHAADLGVTLVELLAYVGDHLSYYQDAVATEAYLDTARQRISVRRHLRLIDYRMHEGTNARAFVTIATDADFGFSSDSEFYFITGFPGITASSGSVVKAPSLSQMQASSYEVFEPVATGAGFAFYAANSTIRFHDWGDAECCLTKGATRATLIDHDDEDDADAELRITLKPGDFLILEEQLGPLTGNSADADPAHRHVVRLTRVTRAHDALLRTLVLDVEWAIEDALPFPLCISSRRPSPECDRVSDVSVARGNVVLVDHGRTRTDDQEPVPWRDVPGQCACEGSIIEISRMPLAFQPVLEPGPVVHAEPVPAGASAYSLLQRDPRAALPIVRLDATSSPLPFRGGAGGGDCSPIPDQQNLAHSPHPNPSPEGEGSNSGYVSAPWTPVPDLLASRGDDRHFVAEVRDDGSAALRFGDGLHGRQPEADTRFTAVWRQGGGLAGNVGREAISHLVIRDGTVSAEAISIRNPLAATGGSAPEPVAEARLFAPGTIQARRERAVVAADYAELARRDARLQGAAAALRWTGSWHEVHVALDPARSDALAPALASDVTGALHRYRRIGHDLAVIAGEYVPLYLSLKVCVLADYRRSQVQAALLDIFSDQTLAGGNTGFFHPDKWQFGQSVYLSQIVAAAMAVEGIETVLVTALHRLNEPNDMSALDTGCLLIRPGEIAQLNHDPNFPEQGELKLTMGGGR